MKKQIRKIAALALATLLVAMPMITNVYAANTTVTGVRETTNLAIRKLMYEGEKKDDFIQNTGQEIELDQTVKAYNPKEFGTVEFTLYKIEDVSIDNIQNKSAQEIAYEVEQAVIDETDLPFGAVEVETKEVNDQGIALFEDVVYNKNIGYVVVETKTPETVKEKSKPLFVQMPLAKADGSGYIDLETVSLYPKNNVEKLNLEFTKYVLRNGETTEATLENIDFKLYFGQPGEGQVIKGEDDQDKIYTTNAEGKIILEDLIVGDYYLVEQAKAGLVEDGQSEEEQEEKLIIGGEAHNDQYNTLTFSVDADGNITTSETFNKYINFEKPIHEMSILNETKDLDLSGTKRNSYTKDELINFSVSTVIPENSKDYSVLEITDELQLDDELSDHLEFDKSTFEVKIKEGEVLTEGEDYTLTFVGNNKFTLSLIKGDKGTSEKVQTTDEVILNYSARFLADAEVTPNGDYSNEARMSYNNTPNKNNKTRTIPSEEKFTTYGFTVKKVDDGVFSSDLLQKPLEGAEFHLLNAEGEVFTGFDKDNAEFEENAENPFVLKSDANGVIKLDGLQSGTYTLREIKAPEGYRLLANPDTEIQVKDDTHTEGVLKDIENERNEDLPITGTEQAVIAMITAVVALGAAGIFMFVSRRKKRTDKIDEEDK